MGDVTKGVCRICRQEKLINGDDRCLSCYTGSDCVDFIGDVEAFHIKFNHARSETGLPRMLPQDLHDFRVKFHKEETGEYDSGYDVLLGEQSMNGEHDEETVVQALADQLDALVDSAWVILGTAEIQFGAARFREAWQRVVEKNMQKVTKLAATEGHVETGRNPKFDIVKPPGWTPPDHTDLVRDHEPLPRS